MSDVAWDRSAPTGPWRIERLHKALTEQLAETHKSYAALVSVPPTDGQRISEAYEHEFWQLAGGHDLRDRLTSLPSDFRSRVNAFIEEQGALVWLSQKIADLRTFVLSLQSVVTGALPKVFSVREANEIENAIGAAIRDLSQVVRDALAWEMEVRAAVAPTGFEPVRRSMEGRTCFVPDVIEQLVEKISRALEEIRGGATRRFDIIPDFSRKFDLESLGRACVGYMRDHPAEIPTIDELANRSRRIPDDVKQFVYERDRGCCVKCSATWPLHYDHIIPYSRGGDNSADNVQVLCSRCNLAKGARI